MINMTGGAPVAPAQGAPTGTAATPAPVAQPAPTPQAQSLTERWMQYIQDPSVKAGLIQAGIAAMQPIAQGQTIGGHLALSIGDGIAAHNRNEQIQLRNEDVAHDNRREDERTGIAADRNQIEREQLAVTEKRFDAQDKLARDKAAYEASQDKIKNALDARRTTAYEAMASKSGSGASTKDPLLQERLDLISKVALDRAFLEDDFDPLAYFDEQAARLSGNAPAATPGAPDPTQAAPAVGSEMDYKGKKYKFLGGNPQDPNAWQEVK